MYNALSILTRWYIAKLFDTAFDFIRLNNVMNKQTAGTP